MANTMDSLMEGWQRQAKWIYVWNWFGIIHFLAFTLSQRKEAEKETEPRNLVGFQLSREELCELELTTQHCNIKRNRSFFLFTERRFGEDSQKKSGVFFFFFFFSRLLGARELWSTEWKKTNVELKLLCNHYHTHTQPRLPQLLSRDGI